MLRGSKGRGAAEVIVCDAFAMVRLNGVLCCIALLDPGLELICRPFERFLLDLRDILYGSFSVSFEVRFSGRAEDGVRSCPNCRDLFVNGAPLLAEEFLFDVPRNM